MGHSMDTDASIVLRTCSECHTTKTTICCKHNKGDHFNTCDTCRLRNKKMNKQPKAYSTFNKQLEEDSMCPTMILTGKSQHILFNQVLEYTAVL